MNTQSNFPKISLFFSAIFLIFSCLIFFFFYRAINNNEKESQAKELEWRNESFRRDEIKTLDRSIKIIEGEMKQLETHFAQSSDIVPFLDTIEGLALKVGAKAEVASVNILTDQTGLMVGLKGSGNFENLYKFLTLLENSPYELEFIDMDLRRETELNAGNKNVTVSKWNVIFTIKLLSFTP